MALDQDLQQNVQKAVQAGRDEQEAMQRALAIQKQRDAQKQPERPGLIRTLLNPFERAGRTIGAGVFEGTVAGIEKFGKATGKIPERAPSLRSTLDVKNPFMSEALLTRMSDPKQAAIESAKTTAGLASYGVPFGKGAGLLKQTIAPGFATGALFEAGQPGATKESITEGGAFGAGGALVFRGAKPLFKKIGEKLTGVEARAGKAIAQPRGGKSVFASAKKQEIVSALKKEGLDPLKMSADEVSEKLPGVYGKLQSKINKILGKSKNEATLDDVSKMLKGFIEGRKAKFFDVADKGMKNTVNQEYRWLEKNAVEGKITAKLIHKWKKSLSGFLGNAFRKLRGELDSPLTKKEQVYMDLWNFADELLSTTEPAVKKLSKRQSMLIQAAPGIEKSVEKSGIRIPFTLMKVGGQEIQKAQGIFGRTVGAIGKVPEAIGEKLPGGTTSQKAGAIGAAALAGKEGKPTPQVGVGDTTIQSDLTGQQEILSPEGQWKWSQEANDWVPNKKEGITSEQLVTAMEKDLQITGGKNISKLKALYDIKTTTKKKDLGAEKSRVMLGNINQLSTLLEKTPTGANAAISSLGSKVPFTDIASDIRVYNSTRQAMIGPVARVISQEVGVLTDRDIKRAEGMLPSIADGPITRAKKLKELEVALANISPDELEARLGEELDTSTLSRQYRDLTYEL